MDFCIRALSIKLPKVSHSTPNNDESSLPTRQASPLMLPLVETLHPVDSSDQPPVSGLDRQDAHNVLTNCTAKPVSTCSTDSDDRNAIPDNSANTTNLANSTSLVRFTCTISTSMSPNTVVSDSPSSQLNLAATAVSEAGVSTEPSETLATSVSTINAHQSTTVRAALMERDSGIEPFAEGLPEEEGETSTENPTTKQGVESTEVACPVESVIQLEEQPGFSQLPSKAVEFQDKKKGTVVLLQ